MAIGKAEENKSMKQKKKNTKSIAQKDHKNKERWKTNLRNWQNI